MWGKRADGQGRERATTKQRREWVIAAHPSLSRVASTDRAPARKGALHPLDLVHGGQDAAERRTRRGGGEEAGKRVNRELGGAVG
jgi:hypothetical protein